MVNLALRKWIEKKHVFVIYQCNWWHQRHLKAVHYKTIFPLCRCCDPSAIVICPKKNAIVTIQSSPHSSNHLVCGTGPFLSCFTWVTPIRVALPSKMSFVVTLFSVTLNTDPYCLLWKRWKTWSKGNKRFLISGQIWFLIVLNLRASVVFDVKVIYHLWESRVFLWCFSLLSSCVILERYSHEGYRQSKRPLSVQIVHSRICNNLLSSLFICVRQRY